MTRTKSWVMAGFLAAAAVTASPGMAHGQLELGAIPLHPTPANYRIRFGDIIRVRVTTAGTDAGLYGDFPVEENGSAFFPRIGPIKAVDLTFEDLRGRLRAAFEKTYPGGALNMAIVFPVSVLGAVGQPRTVEATPGMTVYDAISDATGFRPDANREKIQLIRGDSTFVINALDSETLTNLAQYALQANDRIYVPTRRQITAQLVFAILQGVSVALGIYSVLK